MNIKSELSIGLVKLLLPLAIAGFGILILYLLIDKESSGKLFFLMFAYFIPPLGKESIIPIGVSGGELIIPFINRQIVVPAINPIIMALTIAFVDIVVALFLVWNYDLAKNIPIVGKFISTVEEKGKNVGQKYSWINPLRFIGIVLFVMVPFQGSGGLVGSIVGRLIGMKPWNTFLAISIGAIIGCTLIAMFAKAFFIFVEINTLLTLILVCIIVVVIILYFIIKKRKKQ